MSESQTIYSAPTQENLLFSPSLIPKEVAAALPQGYALRPLARDDVSRGVLDTLSALTTVGDVTAKTFGVLFDHWKSRGDVYYAVAITDAANAVVAVGTVLVERKLIHGCGLVGHIEDIAVNKSQQGKRLGISLISALTAIGKAAGVYKIILDCSEHNVAFYQKCGYSVAGVEMSIRFDKPAL
ncbi:uncharacterized protein SAPINGB_P003202 [Magnusiomyces paraingens]|uniref:Glucosamine 6-phosphate N-acetyltransferase n=1 Tax=Magnusiomyces paraingens TaxID=2606893 RepID=A0A5E8BQF9_9ASCO|nr:uncharacterized protein SAPINGB_P003202 [Saprochaete ingens]VVT51755.1 unnamed protein product [Saprochaete ingens]